MAGGLGLLALGGIGQWGFNQIQGARDRDRRAEFKGDMEAMLGGVDMTTPEGFAMGAQKLMFDPRTQQMGGQMLNNALSRRQDQENIVWGRQNLTKAQEEDLRMAQEKMAQDAWEGQQRVSQGWAGVDINKQQLEMQRQAAERASQMDSLQMEGQGLENQLKQAQIAGIGMPDTQKILARENDIRDKFNQSLSGYRAQTEAFERTMGTLQENNPIAAVASIYNLAKTLDPQGAVLEGDTVMLTSASGALQGLQGAINKLQGGGALTPEIKSQIEDTLLAMQEKAEQGAAVTRQYWETQGGADPSLRLPAVNPRIFEVGNLKASEKYRKKQSAGAKVVPGTNGEWIDIPGMGRGRVVK